jgi:hypothetical protein
MTTTDEMNRRFETLDGRPASPVSGPETISFAGLRFSDHGVAEFRREWDSVAGHDPAAFDAMIAMPMPANYDAFVERWEAVHKAGPAWRETIAALTTIARLDAEEAAHG